ncbi:MAG: NACHT domain-containing protein [Microcystis aeruginosa G13-01]|nr:NACHT domain-containing protein [Microcystis aeruginosa G13-01]
MASQDQNIDHSTIQNSSVQQEQAGRDAVSFLNSDDNRVIINNITQRLFGKSEPIEIDWDWGKRVLKEKQLPEIRQRLTDTLGRGRIFMDVAIAEQLSWVNRSPLEPDRRLQINGEDCGILDPNKMLIETFGRDDIGGQLLILGAAGGGKTTALLSLAEQLVCGALDQPKTVIPALFELSTWRDDKQSIHDWLIEQLYDLHGGNRKRKIYEQWLERQILLPLLDGLDELGLERQQKCTVKLNEFARTYPQLVVCCRVKEFETVNMKLRYLRGAVCLQPLADGQIETYLHRIDRPELWSAMQTNPVLHNLLETTSEGDPGLLRVPLFVKLTADVYDINEPISSKKDLLEKYIERQLSFDRRSQDRHKAIEKREWAYKTVETEPKLQETISSLSWIARQLQANKTVDLLIEKIQFSWLNPGINFFIFRFINLLTITALLAVSYGLRGCLSIGFLGGLLGGLLSVSLLFAEIIVEGSRQSKIGELLLPTIIGIYGGAWIGVILGLIIGIVIGLKNGWTGNIKLSEKLARLGKVDEFTLIMCLDNNFNYNNFDIFFFFWIIVLIIFLVIVILSILSASVWEGYALILIGILTLAILFLFFCALAVIFYLTDRIFWGLSSTEVEKKIIPNQGIWKSIKNALISGVISGILFAPMFKLLIYGLSLEKSMFLGLLVGGIAYGLPYGGMACIQHLFLRLTLWRNGTIPWNFARFLNYCVERRLLLRVGGRYRFLHRELLDHFAQSGS